MKKPKIMIIIQAALMYIAHIFFFTVFFFEIPEPDDNSLGFLLLDIGAAITVVSLVCGVVGIALAAAGLSKGMVSPIKTTLIVKIALIPWYLFNAFYCFYFIAGLLNPMALILIPFGLAIAVFVTYALTVLTGIHDVLYVSGAIKDKRVESSPMLIIGMIMQFFFVFDVVGAIMLHVAMKKAASPAAESR